MLAWFHIHTPALISKYIFNGNQIRINLEACKSRAASGTESILERTESSMPPVDIFPTS